MWKKWLKETKDGVYFLATGYMEELFICLWTCWLFYSSVFVWNANSDSVSNTLSAFPQSISLFLKCVYNNNLLFFCFISQYGLDCFIWYLALEEVYCQLCSSGQTSQLEHLVLCLVCSEECSLRSLSTGLSILTRYQPVSLVKTKDCDFYVLTIRKCFVCL